MWGASISVSSAFMWGAIVFGTFLRFAAFSGAFVRFSDGLFPFAAAVSVPFAGAVAVEVSRGESGAGRERAHCLVPTVEQGAGPGVVSGAVERVAQRESVRGVALAFSVPAPYLHGVRVLHALATQPHRLVPRRGYPRADFFLDAFDGGLGG